MIAALDVYYTDTDATAAAVVFDRWDAEVPVETYTVSTKDCGEYSPGQFYLRELKPLLALISDIREKIDIFVIDGYCHLSPDNKPGLGVHLMNSLPDEPVIIGVAKNRFRDSVHAVEVLRGDSERPLFVTAIGMDYADAASKLASMHGPYRVPTLLKEVDRLSRIPAGEESTPPTP